MKINSPHLRVLKIAVTALFFTSTLFGFFPGLAFAQQAPAEKPYVFVDTDPGVGDAFALAYLLRNQDINLLGVSVVHGNTTLVNGTQNALTVMDVVGRHDVPVYMGEANPLVKPRYDIGMLIHGFDGLWFQQQPHDLSSIPTDAPAAIAEAARNHPGLILIVLGPATNVAKAVQRFPEDMKNAKIYMEAEVTGVELNRLHSDPFAGGFNTWVDPDAVDVLLDAQGLDFTILNGGVIDQVNVDSAEYGNKLLTEGGSLGQFLAAIGIPSWQSATQGAGGPVVLDDLAFSILAIHPEYLDGSVKGLAEVSTHQDFTGGSYAFAADVNSKLVLIATPAELSTLANRVFTDPTLNLPLELFLILSRRADNLNMVTDIRENKIKSIVNSTFSVVE